MNRFSQIIILVCLSVAGLSTGGLASERPGLPVSTASSIHWMPQDGPAQPADVKGPLMVEIKQHGTAFQAYRDGKPYYIRGIGGRNFLEAAAAAGANSIRTWSTQDAQVLLDRARGLNMTVMLGVWLSHHSSDYNDPLYQKRKIEEIRSLVERHKRHPSLLMWSLGNEINLEGADIPEAWRFVNHLAGMIKAIDRNHPVITVICSNQETLNNIAAYAPNLDAVGINAYGALTSLRGMVEGSLYKGPYIITEWGVNGHWEADLTSWGRPIEPTSAQKAQFHLSRYTRDILANGDRCIGSYVFLWGQKQECTPTWFSMFIEDLPGPDAGSVSFPSVDAMYFNWNGNWPDNRAPQVQNMMINNLSADKNPTFTPGELMVSQVQAGDPENDPLSFIWELLEEPLDLGIGGSYEARPKTLVSVRQDSLPEFSLNAPFKTGQYRLFVYVLDHNGHAGSANIPFQVQAVPGRDDMSDMKSAGPDAKPLLLKNTSGMQPGG